MWIDIFLMSGGMLVGYIAWVYWTIARASWHITDKEMRREAGEIAMWKIMRSAGYRCMEWVLILFTFSIMGVILSMAL